MSRPLIQIDDQVREMNEEELAQYEARTAKDLEDKLAREAEIKLKADAIASAEAKLEALGLTADDLRALGL